VLIEQAVERFAAMGLEWHAEQSRKLLAPDVKRPEALAPVNC